VELRFGRQGDSCYRLLKIILQRRATKDDIKLSGYSLLFVKLAPEGISPVFAPIMELRLGEQRDD
jgi:hypothetical protein